ncbi:Ig-like domain-containing protein [bacterium]|nr:Ig-like domain-containing protein [bacterium]
MSQQLKNRFGGFKRVIQIGLIFLPAVLFATSTATVSWQPNQESDLAGYQVHYGTASGLYSMIVDVGNVTQYDVSNLQIGTTYYFAVTAYDNSGNISAYSDEKSYTAQDAVPPTVVQARLLDPDRVKITFSEALDEASAELASNYSINNNIVVQRAELQPDLTSVVLYTIQHANGTYTLTINNVSDRAAIPNKIAANTTVSYSWDQSDEIKPTVASVSLVGLNVVAVKFSEPVEQTSAKTLANYQINGITISNATMTEDYMTVNLTTSNHTPGSSYQIAISNVKDVAANIMTAVTKTYSAPSSNTDAPRLISAVAKSSTEVEIQFSESVSLATAQNTSNYTIPGITILGAVLSASKTTVTLSTSAHSGGSYTVTVTGVQDEGVPPLTLTGGQLPYTYTPPDNIKPVLNTVTVENGGLLRLEFSEALESTSAGLKTNYTISPGIAVQNAFLDNSGLNVYLQTSEHPSGNFTLTASGVKDLAGNVMTSTNKTYSYTPPDRTPPVLAQAIIEGVSYVELVFSEELDLNTAVNIANYQISPAIAVTQADLDGVTRNRVYLKTASHQSGQQYTITVTGVKDKALNTILSGSNSTSYTAPVVDSAPPLLSGVEALGARDIKLSFSESMDETSAKVTANYTIQGISVLEANLDKSQRTVYLKTDEHQAGVQYAVQVANVKDLAGNAIATSSKTYSLPAQDTKAPLVQSVDLIGDQIVVVTFSEPVEASTARLLSNYTINNGITVQRITLSASSQEVHLETTVHPKGAYQLSVKNIKDLSNNTMVASTHSYSYSPLDSDPPQLIQVVVSTPYTLDLHFSEALDPVTAEDVHNYTVKNAVTSEVLTVTKATLDRTNYMVTLMVSTQHIVGNYQVTVSGVKDGNGGNEMSSNMLGYGYAPADNTPPAIESVYLSSSTMLIVKFSEAVETTSAAQKANYAINNGIEIKTVLVNIDGNVALETSEHVAGEYTLTVNGIKDPSNNVIQAYSQKKYMFNPEDNVKPQLVDARLVTDNYLELRFSEAINATDADNLANYSITPYLAIHKATQDANNPDVVYLLTDMHEPGPYTVKVNNVRDRSLNANVIGENNTKQYLYSTPDVNPPVLQSVKASTPYALYLFFDEQVSMESAQNESNYIITPKVEVIQASIIDNRQTVYLETGKHDGGISYSIEVRNLADRAPSPNVMTTPQTGTYVYDPGDVQAPVLMSVKLLRTDYLELVFSEMVEKSSAETRSNYRIDPGVEIGNIVLDEQTQKKVYIETSLHFPGIVYSINVRNVRDLAAIPNTIDKNTYKSYQVGDNVLMSTEPFQVARIEPLSTTQVDVVFTRPVNQSTAENKNNYVINDGDIAVQAAVVDSNLTRVHLTTAVHELGQAYRIQVNNIQEHSSQLGLLAATPGIQYIMIKGMSISGLNRTSYQLSVFKTGADSYVDRDYTLAEAPEALSGAVQIQTANDDKSDVSDSFLSFELKGGAKCLVAYDARIDSLPVWLAQWKPTGERLIDSRQNVFNLYEKSVPEGKVILGGNAGGMDDAMYMVFAIAQKASGALVTSLSKTNYQLAYLALGDKLYIDRDYTLSSVPPSLNGLIWLKTANDDKTNREPDFLSFNVSDSSEVYVGYDAQIAAFPNWLSGWEACGEQVVDSRGTQYNLYTKRFSAGEVVLGGNCGTLDDNMYVVALQSFGSDELSKWLNKPGFFTLEQNYPNPFNPVTNIKFAVHKPGHVVLSIYNVLGQRVRVLVDRELTPGPYTELWDARDDRGVAVSTGVYFYRIQQGDFAKTKRMMLVR